MIQFLHRFFSGSGCPKNNGGPHSWTWDSAKKYWRCGACGASKPRW
jgi:hypothetical protein